MAPSHETIVRNTYQTTEWLILHKMTGDWTTLTFLRGNHSTAQVVTSTGQVMSMSIDNALMTLAYTTRHNDYDVCEV